MSGPCEHLPPPPEGSSCVNCWQCLFPPGSTRGTCEYVAYRANTEHAECKDIGTYNTKEECQKACGIPPITCYNCSSVPGTGRNECIVTHPVHSGTNQPYDNCTDLPNTYDTMAECQSKCEDTPVAASCWAIGSVPNCTCVFGSAHSPDGHPLDHCDNNLGYYDSQGTCVQACEDSKRTHIDKGRMYWIIGGVIGGLVILFIIGLIIFALYKHSQKNKLRMIYL